MQVTLDDMMIARLRERRIFFENDRSQLRLRQGNIIRFANNTAVEPYCGILAGNSIPTIGSFSYSWSPLHEGMTIGRYCSIAGGLQIPAPRHPIDYISTSSFVYDEKFSIVNSFLADQGDSSYKNYSRIYQKPYPVIGNDVWIGQNVALLPGITIGNGAVIAARAVVTKDVPEFSIFGGNPAKLIRFRFSEKVMEGLRNVQWWRYKFSDFSGLTLSEPDRFIEEIASRYLSEFSPSRIKLAEILQQ
jgi:acetyltransferase-like isoleucine patch superfamily enzyme